VAKLVIMFVLIGGQGGPLAIPGWASMNACNAAKQEMTTFFKAPHGRTSYVNVQVTCLEFPNQP